MSYAFDSKATNTTRTYASTEALNEESEVARVYDLYVVNLHDPPRRMRAIAVSGPKWVVRNGDGPGRAIRAMLMLFIRAMINPR